MIAFVRIIQVSYFFSPLIQKPYFSLTIFTLEFKMPTVGLEIQLMGTALAYPKALGLIPSTGTKMCLIQIRASATSRPVTRIKSLLLH